jgi:acyl-CoA thioesterase I
MRRPACGFVTRRSWVAATAVFTIAGTHAASDDVTLVTLGDSILDCGRYNTHRLHPGALVVRNDDVFPQFRGQDLASRRRTRLAHGAMDGATVENLKTQLERVGPVRAPAALMLTVGGNDLLRGLAGDGGAGVLAFERKLQVFLAQLSIRPVFIGNVYDPTFGDDTRNFLGVAAVTVRLNHARVNDVLGRAAEQHGALVDLHAHFLHGDSSWFTNTIEPSLIGASEVRRAFLPHVLAAALRL